MCSKCKNIDNKLGENKIYNCKKLTIIDYDVNKSNFIYI